MSRVAWGKGKREVLLLRAEIYDLFAQGATVEEAYRVLSDRLTVSKPTFRRHAATLRKAAHPVQKPKPPSTPAADKTNDGESPSIEGTFSYDPSATDEDLW